MGPSLLAAWKVRSGFPGLSWEFSTKIDGDVDVDWGPVIS